jgi:hypothetical protein
VKLDGEPLGIVVEQCNLSGPDTAFVQVSLPPSLPTYLLPYLSPSTFFPFPPPSLHSFSVFNAALLLFLRREKRLFRVFVFTLWDGPLASGYVLTVCVI